MWPGINHWGWGMGIGWLFMLLFWLLAVVGIVALIKWFVASSNAGGSRALNTLKERYAKGDITREQFEQMKRDIES